MKTTSRRLCRLAKQGHVGGRGKSYTAGSSKGESCQADWRKKFYFCNPRARNDKDYPTWHQKAKDMNKGG